MLSRDDNERATRRCDAPGVEGAGEAGTVGALPAVMNAIINALSPLGIGHLDMLASPERVWRTIRAAGAAG